MQEVTMEQQLSERNFIASGALMGLTISTLAVGLMLQKRRGEKLHQCIVVDVMCQLQRLRVKYTHLVVTMELHDKTLVNVTARKQTNGR